MTTHRKVTIGILLAAMILVGLAVMDISRGLKSTLFGFNRGMHARYEKVSQGDSKQSVVDALGESRAKSNTFNLPQRHGFDHLFEAAEKSSAVEYYQWINGMNWFYSIGFNAAGEVVIKGEGHS